MIHIITEHIDTWTAARTSKGNGGRGRGRGSNGQSPHGIKKLRELILELAVRGKLVPQDPRDEPASELLKKIAREKTRLIKEGKIKKQKPLAEIREEEKPFDLPKGWEWVRLGEITNYGTFEKAEPSGVDKSTWVLELEDVEKITSKLLHKIKFIDRPFKSSKNRFSAKDVIYGKLRPYLDKVIIADESGVCTTEMIPLRGYIKIIPEYLRFVMKSPYFIRYANESTHGMNLPRLGTDKARLALLPITSEEEQHRIVAKVDELMALCDKLEREQSESDETHETLVATLLDTLTSATDHKEFAGAWRRIADHFDALFTTEKSIDKLKQIILQLAVMGKLVPQDPKDEPAGELLKKIAREKTRLIKEGKIKRQKPLPEIKEEEKPFDLPKGWEWVRLSNYYDVRDGTHDSPKYHASGYPLVTSKNLSSGKLDLTNINYISEKDHLNIIQRSRVDKGDVLFAMIGSIGNPVIVDTDDEFSIKNVALFKYYIAELSSPKYLKNLLESAAFVMRENAPGGVQSFVSLGILRTHVIPLPPLAEQHRIVAKVDELMALCDSLKERLREAQATQVHLADAIVEQAVGV